MISYYRDLFCLRDTFAGIGWVLFLLRFSVSHFKKCAASNFSMNSYLLRMPIQCFTVIFGGKKPNADLMIAASHLIVEDCIHITDGLMVLKWSHVVLHIELVKI